MAATITSLPLFRGIIRELRKIYGKELYRSPAYLYVKNEFHKSNLTSEKYCRSKTDLQYQAVTYLTLLQSSRLHEEVSELYRGEGEKSVESSAELVGLKLPKTYSPDPKPE